MNEFITKPFNPEDLICALCHWINKDQIPPPENNATLSIVFQLPAALNPEQYAKLVQVTKEPAELTTTTD